VCVCEVVHFPLGAIKSFWYLCAVSGCKTATAVFMSISCAIKKDDPSEEQKLNSKKDRSVNHKKFVMTTIARRYDIVRTLFAHSRSATHSLSLSLSLCLTMSSSRCV